MASLMAALPARAQDSNQTPAQLTRSAADLYDQGKYSEALVLIQKSVDLGDADAEYILGIMYKTGHGVSIDQVKAAEWFRKAADQGQKVAQTELGIAYHDGRGVPKDDAACLAWMRKAAAQGFAPAEFSVGSFYAEGRIVGKDYGQALVWLRKSADQGYALAELRLGEMYAQGQGVKVDPELALDFLRKSATQGNAQAADIIGAMYDDGIHKDGVEFPSDLEQAKSWYRKAAELGNESAKRRLEELQGPPIAARGSISLVCTERTNGGDPIKTYLYIDPARKYVRYEFQMTRLEYTDGVTSNIATKGAEFIGVHSQLPTLQFVTINDDVIEFGSKTTRGTSTTRIDRHSGFLTIDNGRPNPCVVAKGF